MARKVFNLYVMMSQTQMLYDNVQVKVGESEHDVLVEKHNGSDTSNFDFEGDHQYLAIERAVFWYFK
ncbi:MAG TPA: hypothetical protein EYQ50_17285 [Verrucomicrobiales bacterium]|nr:hypothetical protein [Verrucomicrobiales bacterium]HIL72108.1 hypothetical protein [Verrucomicrobiota bacterium]